MIIVGFCSFGLFQPLPARDRTDATPRTPQTTGAINTGKHSLAHTHTICVTIRLVKWLKIWEKKVVRVQEIPKGFAGKRLGRGRGVAKGQEGPQKMKWSLCNKDQALKVIVVLVSIVIQIYTHTHQGGLPGHCCWPLPLWPLTFDLTTVCHPLRSLLLIGSRRLLTVIVQFRKGGVGKKSRVQKYINISMKNNL